MKLGQAGDAHDVVHPQYSFWGRAGNIQLKLNLVSDEIITNVYHLLHDLKVSLADYHLTHANNISYYQGEQLSAANAVLLRFERLDGKNTGYTGEHISVIYDVENQRLLGLTRMQAALDNQSFVTHQQALISAINFMKQAAPDLIAPDTTIPELIDLPKGERMGFVPAAEISCVHLHWMGDHGETILVDDAEHEVHGMKVKMQIPGDELYAWVIIDKYGDIATFERNISWDFAAMQRKTQMWLHDHWLLAQGIQLQAVTSKVETPQLQASACPM